MSWFLMLAGLMLMICRESGALSSDWKTIFLGISFALINIAFSITCNIHGRMVTEPSQITRYLTCSLVFGDQFSPGQKHAMNTLPYEHVLRNTLF